MAKAKSASVGAGLFQRVIDSKKSETVLAPKKKSTTWMVGSSEDSLKVSQAVSELRKLNADAKAIAARMEVHKTLVLRFARDSFFTSYADDGVFPETPMLVQNQDGERCTFVVQDRSSQYSCKPEQIDALVSILGEDAARDMVASELNLGFRRDAMINPKIQRVLEAHLSAAIAELQEAELIESPDDVFEVEQKTAFKPGTLQRLGLICGKDTTKMRQVMDAMGSAAVSYIKP